LFRHGLEQIVQHGGDPVGVFAWRPRHACEQEGLVAALSLRDAEKPMRTRVVDRPRAFVIDHQPSRFWKNRVLEIVLRTDGAPACPVRPAGHQSSGSATWNPKSPLSARCRYHLLATKRTLCLWHSNFSQQTIDALIPDASLWLESYDLDFSNGFSNRRSSGAAP
jgi:hypothetical protein